VFGGLWRHLPALAAAASIFCEFLRTNELSFADFACDAHCSFAQCLTFGHTLRSTEPVRSSFAAHILPIAGLQLSLSIYA
jgi:hypothetical protein